MSKIETARQLAQTQSAQRIEHLASQMQQLKDSKIQSVEELAQMIEPLAQSIAALTDETRETLSTIDARSKNAAGAIARERKQLLEAINEAKTAATEMQQEAGAVNLKMFAIALLTGVFSAVAVTGLLHFLGR